MEQINTIMKPIKKKWVFHFIVSPKTNVIEKPEWYLNQTLKWIHEHIDTIESKVKLDSKLTTGSLNVRHQFILSMVELAMLRLKEDMNKISDNLDQNIHNEAILTHTYNEVILFTKVIRQLLGKNYSNIDDRYDLLSVFSDQKLFETIIDIEWEHSEKNLNEITTSLAKWEPVLQGDFVDNYKIPRCVDSLLMLIKSISERVECFRQLDCKFKLIELQCFLFNQFLTFLKQSTESTPASMSILSDMLFFGEESTIDLTRILRILNGVNFLRLVLKERYFISDDVISQLDASLLEKCNKLAQDYKTLFYKLINEVVGIYEQVDTDLDKFLDFIEPKLSNHIFKIIHDETSKIHQEKQTQSLLGGLSFGGGK